ncbi:MAG: TonB-dependent receptor [Thermoanaerobaculia bacterium]|nr:TonB-dependent receptor [Thermoanaerobaculia bacterium]
MKVTISSPAMQGTRSTSSNINGDYNFGALPPGKYTVRFESQGMAPEARAVIVGLARTERVNATLAALPETMQPLVETIAVTARNVPAAPSVLETTEIQSNYTAELVDELPIERTVQSVTRFSPGVRSSALGRESISGAPVFDSVYLVNGVVTNEPISPTGSGLGSMDNFYIEDAVLETSVLQGSISAEYGRFTGGLVSVVTKFGGNETAGSLRDSLRDPAWTSPSAYGEPEQEKNLEHVYEATLGGRIVRDRLWFFVAGRFAETSLTGVYKDSKQPMPPAVTRDERVEAKLTGQISSKQSLVAAYLDYDRGKTNVPPLSGAWEASALDSKHSIPGSMTSLNYSGVLRNNLLVEAAYSTRSIEFLGRGGDHLTRDATNPRDIALGSLGFDRMFLGSWGAPDWCGVCGRGELWDNELYNLKGTYYVDSRALGTHTIVAGYEKFAESRYPNNYQSGSNYLLYIYATPPTRDVDGTLRPVVSAGDVIVYAPIHGQSNASNFVTNTLFVNDKWDLSSRWSFNLGVRHDQNDSVAAGGVQVSGDGKASPRLGAIFDVRGDGRYRINASFSRYVSKLDEYGGGAASAGQPWFIAYEYRGPTVGGPQTGLGSFDVLEQVFRWFLDQGGVTAADLVLGTAIAGVNTRVTDLQSMHVDEWSVGFGAQLGSRGVVRLDWIDRAWADLYAQSSVPGDVVENPIIPGDRIDVTNHGNTNRLERAYRALTIQSHYRFNERLTVGGHYTWSEALGNWEDFQMWQNSDKSPFLYAEYKAFAQFSPSGRLALDQPHKARVWLGYHQPLGRFGNVNVSILERLDSGRPYSAQEVIRVGAYVANPGYATPPARVDYYFSDRGAYRWETATATDLAINYEVPIQKVSVFAQAEVLNLFDEQAQIGGNAGVQVIAPFDPFHEVPKECPRGQSDCTGFHWQKRPTFGTAIGPPHYQTPLTYRFSAGLRF